jgi:hypothetical protein
MCPCHNVHHANVQGTLATIGADLPWVDQALAKNWFRNPVGVAVTDPVAAETACSKCKGAHAAVFSGAPDELVPAPRRPKCEPDCRYCHPQSWR